jgi:transcription termination factor Rho
MELVLDRKLSEKRVFPAIDIPRSSTRREELLLEETVLKQVVTLRRMLAAIGGSEGIEAMMSRMARTASNKEFLANLSKDIL